VTNAVIPLVYYTREHAIDVNFTKSQLSCDSGTEKDDGTAVTG